MDTRTTHIYVFSSYDSTSVVPITQEQLSWFPDCLFSKLVEYNLGRDKHPNGTFKTSLTSDALKCVNYFFNNGYWKNPYLAENEKLHVFGENYTFEQACGYIGLPDHLIEEVEDDYEFYDDWTQEELDELAEVEEQEERDYQEYLLEKRFEDEMERRERSADYSYHHY